MSKLSRRSLVTSAAALPALAVPAVVIAATADPDPIYAAIEGFKKALDVEEKLYEAQRDAQSREEVEDLEDEAYDAASDRIKAMRTVFETTPMTLAGMRAKIDFAGSMDHVTESLQQTHDPKRLKDFLETLYECAAQLVA
jgi:hypothetical protein